jgi:pilus assembly protein FimV
MLAEMPEETEADGTTSEMKEEAAMDEMVAAAMEEGTVDAENQFELDDVFGNEAAVAQQAAETADDEDMSMGDLVDLLPADDGEAAAPVVAADDHTEALAAAFDESATKDLEGLDFGFNVDLGEAAADAPVTKAAPAPKKAAPKKAAPKKAAAKKPAAKKSKKVEVEDIDLDVAGTGNQAAAAVTNESEESAEIDTMLDLVTAYIDMSDEEGARDLLKEILEKGGSEQKVKAQKMLDDLG